MDRIEALRQKIPALERRAEKLRSESNCICGFEPGPDGKPQIICSDDARLLAIGQEMMAIRRQQYLIEEALKRIEEIAGEESTLGSITANHMRQVEYAARLRSDFMMEFDDISRRRPTGCLTPAEVMSTVEYKVAADRFEPEIRNIEAAANESAQLITRIRTILSELPN